MNEWNIYVILLNTANIIFLAAFMAKKLVWLRLLAITGYIISVPYYLYYIEPPLWNTIVWVCIYTLGNALYHLPRK